MDVSSTMVLISYFLGTRRINVSFEKSDPEWRETISLLREQGRHFTLSYL